MVLLGLRKKDLTRFYTPTFVQNVGETVRLCNPKRTGGDIKIGNPVDILMKGYSKQKILRPGIQHFCI